MLVDETNIFELMLNNVKFLYVGIDYKKYKQYHLRNSVFVNGIGFKTSKSLNKIYKNKTNAIIPNQLISDISIKDIISELKILKNDNLIIYCEEGDEIQYAFHFIHILYGIGFKNVMYLNLNYNDLPRELLSNELAEWDVPLENTNYFIDLIDSQELSSLLINNSININILDIRNPDDFFSGHIPNSINIHWELFFIPSTSNPSKPSNILKSSNEIIKMLNIMGMNGNTINIITGTNGYDVCSIVFILRHLLNWKNVKCHMESWEVWSYLNQVNIFQFPIEY